MEIIHREDGICVEKPEGTRVVYHIFREYEIHYNEVLPRTVQQWHHHEEIEETIYFLSGTLQAYWIDEEEHKSASLRPGDIVRVERSSHTFANLSDETAQFLVFRSILTNSDLRDRIKSDKVVDVQHPI